MPEIEADFEISTNNLEAEYEITQREHFDCSFEIHVTPDISHLATKQELQETAELINNRIDSVVEDVAEIQEEVEKKVETITGSPLINVERSGNSVNITSKTFVFEQAIPSKIWEITHNLNKRPNITLTYYNGEVFEAYKEYIDNNNVRIILGNAATGYANLN